MSTPKALTAVHEKLLSYLRNCNEQEIYCICLINHYGPYNTRTTSLSTAGYSIEDNEVIIDDFHVSTWIRGGNKIALSYSVHHHQTLINTAIYTIATTPKIKSFLIDYESLYVFPKEICSLIELANLTIKAPINKLPPEINKLTNLERLAVSGNLQSLPKEIGSLNRLHTLELASNSLTELPVEINNLKSLKKLNLQGNRIPVPPEILERTDNPQTILNYYFAIAKVESDPRAVFNTAGMVLGKALNELKLLFIGQGSVGKTSLVNRLIFSSFDYWEAKTDGITIERWQVEIRSELENRASNISLHLWDFGGQEIMHATHQFFLTKRSLYILVLDSRLTQEENRVEYWLKIIQSFGGDSPVLIVGNKIDQHPLDIDRTGLQKKYPNIVGILETSAATGAGIEGLKAAITEQVNNLPHVRDLLPETWFTVKTKLEELGRKSNFITHDKYLELCAENEVSDETSQRTLIGFLHDLGVVLHFQDDPRLEALGILNPQWVTNGVYKILNSHTLFQNKGVLTVSMLDEILNLPEYPRSKRLFIVDMMKKFELCYDIEPDKSFLVPDLLPKDEPAELKFTGIPAFEYAYPVLPSSVITRFIVRMNQKIEDGLDWRTGVLLKIGENHALVKADIEDRKITIAIDGLEHTRRDALSAIRYQLDEIHASIKGLDPQKKVPVPNAPKAEPLKYEYLLKLERAGQESLLVENGNDLVTVNVRQILSAIETEAQRKESGGTVTNIYIGGNVEGSNIVSGNNNVIMQRIQDSFNKADAADIQAELKATLKQLADAVAVMTKSLPAEQAAEVTDDLSKLVDEATKPTPSKKWYSVSIDGLIKAAENVEKVGEPVINLSRKVLSLLTGGVIK
jgi:internalin A